MKIRIIKSFGEFGKPSFNEGDEFEADTDTAIRLIQQKRAIPVPTEPEFAIVSTPEAAAIYRPRARRK